MGSARTDVLRRGGGFRRLNRNCRRFVRGARMSKPKGQGDYHPREYVDAEVQAVSWHGYRPGLDAPDQDYRSVEHEDLVGYVIEGVDPDAVNEQSELVNDIGNTQKELSAQFAQAAAR